MSRKTGIVLSIAALAAVGAIIAFLLPRGEGPPRDGWMKAFDPAAGSTAPIAGAIYDERGAAVPFDRFRGKLVLLNLWATWCGPCIREMPSLIRLREKLREDDVAIVALSQDRGGWKVIAPFVAKHDLAALAIYHDRDKLSFGVLKVRGLPTTILYDRQGRELGRLAGPAEWDTPEALALIRYYLGS